MQNTDVTMDRKGGLAMFPLRTALAAGAGVFAFAATSLAGQSVNLMAPTPLIPAGGAIQQAPLLSTEVTGAPYTPSASGYLSAVPYLDAAQMALQSGRYSAARGALEQAETRLLNDGAVADTGSISAGGQALTQVRLARDAAIRHDRRTALTAASMARAVAETPTPTQPMPIEAQAAPQAPAALPAPPPPPMITKVLLPGHWQLGSWQYHWVPPETQLRTVETHPWVQGHYVWSGGAWNWIPSHYDDE